MESSMVGLDRKITLFDCNGDTIRTWRARTVVEAKGSIAAFLDEEGREVKISGTFVIEEIRSRKP